MSSHDFTSSEYFAQQTVMAIKREEDYCKYKFALAGFKAEHHGNRADIFLLGHKYSINYENRGEAMFAVVEADEKVLGEARVKIDRSRVGKISPPDLVSFLNEQIHPIIKKSGQSK